MKLSIVILNWNGVGMMQRFLPDIVKYSPGAEVVVADNASTDASLEWLKEAMPRVRTIVLDKNYGFAGGYNRALKQVEAEYFLILNSDVEVREGWLDGVMAYMEAHPECAACQPKLLCQWSPNDFEYAGAAGGFIDRLGYPYCRGRLFGTVETDTHQYDEPIECLWATGACLLIRSADFWKVGGFDDRFFAHQEEIDLCWRLRSRGRKVMCVPQSVAYHLGGGTLPQGNPRKDFLNFRNNLLLLYKNLPDDGELRRVMRWRFWLDALASLQFLLTGHWGSCKAVWQGRRAFHRMKADFLKDREENRRLAVENPLKDAPGSLLWQYYIKGRKQWNRLSI